MASRKTGLRRGAFTLVELLVVISIIGMLMALLLPAVQQAREAGRRNTCNSNLHNLALGVINFSGAKGSYPGYVEPLLLSSNSTGATTTAVYPVSWMVPILPYLERTDIYTLMRNQPAWGLSGVPGWPPGGGTTATDPPPVYMDILNCPSTPPASKQGNTPCVYVANSGMMDVTSSAGTSSAGPYPADFQANGVFFNRFNPNQFLATGTAVTLYGGGTTIAANVSNLGPMVSTSQDYITVHDGSSLTFMLSENNYAPWAQQTSGTVTAIQSPYNGASYWGTGISISAPYAAGTEPQNCFVWWPDAQPNTLMKINSPQTARASATGVNIYYTMAPSSNHPTGTNVAFCDGHTRFISQDIDYTVFCLLMTPWGQMCNTPGTASGALDPGTTSGSIYYPSGTGNYGILRNKPIDESQIN
jgi:prepilin-type N-terminal cleavage/methylation domain-containing protein/prepilin-type processing-associated H-X9-DG protein